jgi:hypothetical protein
MLHNLCNISFSNPLESVFLKRVHCDWINRSLPGTREREGGENTSKVTVDYMLRGAERGDTVSQSERAVHTLDNTTERESRLIHFTRDDGTDSASKRSNLAISALTFALSSTWIFKSKQGLQFPVIV